MALSLYALFAPAEPGPELFPNVDKVAHLLIFLALATTARWDRGPRPAVLAVVAAYAPVSELVQGLIGRDADPLDAVADLVGVALGWLVLGPRLPRRPRAVSGGRW